MTSKYNEKRPPKEAFFHLEHSALFFCCCVWIVLFTFVKQDLNMRSAYNPSEQEELLLDQAVDRENQIILYNDEVNTFDWVIECLVSICQHDPMQAEQCSLIVHYNGKCAVKEGAFDHLRPICEALIDRGLSATIE